MPSWRSRSTKARFWGRGSARSVEPRQGPSAYRAAPLGRCRTRRTGGRPAVGTPGRRGCARPRHRRVVVGYPRARPRPRRTGAAGPGAAGGRGPGLPGSGCAAARCRRRQPRTCPGGGPRRPSPRARPWTARPPPGGSRPASRAPAAGAAPSGGSAPSATARPGRAHASRNRTRPGRPRASPPGPRPARPAAGCRWSGSSSGRCRSSRAAATAPASGGPARPRTGGAKAAAPWRSAPAPGSRSPGPAPGGRGVRWPAPAPAGRLVWQRPVAETRCRPPRRPGEGRPGPRCGRAARAARGGLGVGPGHPSRWVCAERSGYRRPSPRARSIPMWANQMSAADTARLEPPSTPPSARTAGGT